MDNAIQEGKNFHLANAKEAARMGHTDGQKDIQTFLLHYHFGYPLSFGVR